MEIGQLLKEYAPGMNFTFDDKFHESIAQMYENSPKGLEMFIVDMYGEQKFRDLVKEYMDSLERWVNRINQEKKLEHE